MTVHPKVGLSKHDVPHALSPSTPPQLNSLLAYLGIPGDSCFGVKAGLSTMTVHPKVNLSNAPCTTHSITVKSLLAYTLDSLGTGFGLKRGQARWQRTRRQICQTHHVPHTSYEHPPPVNDYIYFGVTKHSIATTQQLRCSNNCE